MQSVLLQACKRITHDKCRCTVCKIRERMATITAGAARWNGGTSSAQAAFVVALQVKHAPSKAAALVGCDIIHDGKIRWKRSTTDVSPACMNLGSNPASCRPKAVAAGVLQLPTKRSPARVLVCKVHAAGMAGR